jgi:hypothetical protein
MLGREFPKGRLLPLSAHPAKYLITLTPTVSYLDQSGWRSIADGPG